MTLPTLQLRLADFAAREQPTDYFTSVDPIQVGEANLTALTVMWEGGGALDVPREARAVFGGDGRLLWVSVLDPGLFFCATEEGYGLERADELATRKLESVEELFHYLRGERYEVAVT